jgi:hypothetical protein
MLTEWSREELLGTKKYIWEVSTLWVCLAELRFLTFRKLFENQSAVEYWENFAKHAFENTAQPVYSHCVLLKPNGTPVPATFCFHIRRDLFDMPSLVIGMLRAPIFYLSHRSTDNPISFVTGQWLPLL